MRAAVAFPMLATVSEYRGRMRRVLGEKSLRESRMKIRFRAWPSRDEGARLHTDDRAYEEKRKRM